MLNRFNPGNALVLGALAAVSACSSGGSDDPPSPVRPTVDLRADQAQFVDQSGQFDDYSQGRIDCVDRGWTKAAVETDIGQTRYLRKVLYKLPTGDSWRGVLLVMHGGGANYSLWCESGVSARGMMANKALAEGFAVILLDSSDIVTDQNGELCGKVWDDTVLARENLDIPYISTVIDELVPGLNPSAAVPEVFLLGFSSGGFMVTRAATELNRRVSGFIPIASGTPYGWSRDCSFLVDRNLVAGVGLDNDTNLPILTEQACGPNEPDPLSVYPNELDWLDGGALIKPTYFKIHHFYDAVADFSCHVRHIDQLGENGYAGSALEPRPDGAVREVSYHNFLPEFIEPVIDYLLASTQG